MPRYRAATLASEDGELVRLLQFNTPADVEQLFVEAGLLSCDYFSLSTLVLTHLLCR